MNWVINDKYRVMSYGGHIFYSRSSDMKYLTVRLIACDDSLCPVSFQGCKTSSEGSHLGCVQELKKKSLQLFSQRNKIYH